MPKLCSGSRSLSPFYLYALICKNYAKLGKYVNMKCMQNFAKICTLHFAVLMTVTIPCAVGGFRNYIFRPCSLRLSVMVLLLSSSPGQSGPSSQAQRASQGHAAILCYSRARSLDRQQLNKTEKLTVCKKCKGETSLGHIGKCILWPKILIVFK